MNYSRRELSMALVAALTASSAAAAESGVLPTTTLKYEDLPVKTNGPNKSRAMLKGKTHTGFPIELHETELAPGQAPHPPHEHAHEEMIVIHEGDMEVTISGKTTRLGAGSVVYVASGEHHGWRNVGTTRARYVVMALGRES